MAYYPFKLRSSSLSCFASLAIAALSIGFASAHAQAASLSYRIFTPDGRQAVNFPSPSDPTAPLLTSTFSNPNPPLLITRSEFSTTFVDPNYNLSISGTWTAVTGSFQRTRSATTTAGSLIRAISVKLSDFTITNNLDVNTTYRTGQPLIDFTGFPGVSNVQLTSFYSQLTGEVEFLLGNGSNNQPLPQPLSRGFNLTFTPGAVAGSFQVSQPQLNITAQSSSLILKSQTASSAVYIFQPSGAGGTLNGLNLGTINRLLGNIASVTLPARSTIRIKDSLDLLFTEPIPPDEVPTSDEVGDLVNVLSGLPIDDPDGFNFNVFVYLDETGTESRQVNPFSVSEPSSIPEPSSFLGLVVIGGFLASIKSGLAKRLKG